jgi:hypothetical protein
MNPQRKAIYEAALLTLKNPEDLRNLSDAFAGEGLEEEAEVLRKRAILRETPPEIHAKRREAFKLGMSCLDPVKVTEFADAFSECACYSAAGNLRKYASGLSSDDADMIANIILDLRSHCEIIPETGKVRSKAFQKAIENLEERQKSMVDGRLSMVDSGQQPTANSQQPS